MSLVPALPNSSPVTSLISMAGHSESTNPAPKWFTGSQPRPCVCAVSLWEQAPVLAPCTCSQLGPQLKGPFQGQGPNWEPPFWALQMPPSTYSPQCSVRGSWPLACELTEGRALALTIPFTCRARPCASIEVNGHMLPICWGDSRSAGSASPLGALPAPQNPESRARRGLRSGPDDVVQALGPGRDVALPASALSLASLGLPSPSLRGCRVPHPLHRTRAWASRRWLVEQRGFREVYFYSSYIYLYLSNMYPSLKSLPSIFKN